MLGKNVSALMPPPDRGQIVKRLRDFISRGEDSGPGLPPDVVDRLFQPFLSTKADGMGVGLSICQVIVAGHGGRIWTGRSALGGIALRFTLMDASGDANG